MAAIPKPDGDVRLIHDCSRPIGEAVNDYCSTDWQQKFARVDDAAAEMTEGCYFAKVDLRSAYRSVHISKSSQAVTGLSWNLNGKTVFLKDTRLPFGARLSVGIFHRLTQAVRRMMVRKGYDLTIVYLDDFLIISKSKQACAAIWLKPDLRLLCPPVDLTLTRERSSSLTSVFRIVLFLNQPIAARVS